MSGMLNRSLIARRISPGNAAPPPAPLASILQRLQRFCQEQTIECYLVGGSLRDLLLGRTPQDLDLVIPGDAAQIARRLADTLTGDFAALGPEKAVWRVMLPPTFSGKLYVDIAALRGEDILDDLQKRDFTINALALRLEALPALEAPAFAQLLIHQDQQACALLLDPADGLSDLRSKRLRVVQETVFQDDPLRLLRAIRLHLTHQLLITPSTASLMRRDARLLRLVAPERIRDELRQMLRFPHTIEAARALEEYRLFPAIFPSLYRHDGHDSTATPLTTQQSTRNEWVTLATTSQLIRAWQGKAPAFSAPEQAGMASFLQMSQKREFRRRWKKSPGRAYPRSILFLLAALLSDLLTGSLPTERPTHTQPATYPPEQLQGISTDLKRLSWGHQAVAFVISLLQENGVAWALEPPPDPMSATSWRAARHYLQRLGERGIDLALFCLICQIAHLKGASPDPSWQARAQTIIALIDTYYQQREALIPPLLIDGETLKTSLGLTSGPQIGALLAQARYAQLEGFIQTREEALQFIADHMSKRDYQEPQREKRHI